MFIRTVHTLQERRGRVMRHTGLITLAVLLAIAGIAARITLAAPRTGVAAATGKVVHAPQTDYTFTVDVGYDSHDANPGDHICNDGVSGCSLRAAIEEAFYSSGNTRINVPVNTVTLDSALGTISWPASNTTVDGSAAQPSFGHNAIVTGASLSSGQSIFQITGNANHLQRMILQHAPADAVEIGDYTGTGTGNGNTVDTVTITGSGSAGVYIRGGGAGGGNGNAVLFSMIGASSSTATTCATGEGNGFGVYIALGATNTIVQNDTIDCNTQTGVALDGTGGTSYVSVDDNAIGTSSVNDNRGNGVSGVEAYYGVHNVTVANSTIGGSAGQGVYLLGSGTQAQLTGNLIGTNFAPNGQGVLIQNSAANTLVNNTIVDNTTLGVHITGAGSTGNVVVGGAIADQGGNGVQIDGGAATNTIGSSLGGAYTPAQIVGNGGNGVYISGADTHNNNVFGNYIGIHGAGADPNAHNGVMLDNGTHGNAVGTTLDNNTRNIISGNTLDGVLFTGGATSNVAGSNIIGLNAAGDAAIPNLGNGVTVENSPHNFVGDSVDSSFQYISGNHGAGIYVHNSDSTFIGQNDYVGVGADGVTAVGNGTWGVLLDGATNTSAYPWVVSNNGRAGVSVTGGSGAIGNEISIRTVRNNGGLPVDLNDDGPTANDPGDLDVGPNTLLNYPVITSSSGGNVSGTVCANCLVYLYQAVGNPRSAGGGGLYKASATADSSGNWTAPLPAGLTRYNITLQACEAPCTISGNTSEMSPLDSPLPSCSTQFQDVTSSSPFYTYVRCLACQGVLGGYTCGGAGEPCVAPNNYPYFRTNANITRGQIAKVVSNAAALSADPGAQIFQDVPVGSTFYTWVNRLAHLGYMSGYPCGGTAEPCVPPANLPYFRPNANASRGQLAKIVSNAALFGEAHSEQTFEDVPPSAPFYIWVERLASRGYIGGYPCGGAGEPCVPPGNRAYFRPNNPVTRGQASKIVSNSFFPACASGGVH